MQKQRILLRYIFSSDLNQRRIASTVATALNANSNGGEVDRKRDYSRFSAGKTIKGSDSVSTKHSPLSTRTNYCVMNRLRAAASQCDKPAKTLITGGMGQLGRNLAYTLQNSVILTDICKFPDFMDKNSISYKYLNIVDKQSIEEVVVNEGIDTIVHFSALLSAVAEQNIDLALQVNVQGVQNVLTIAKTHKLKVFIPSTIGVFGNTTPRQMTPDLTIQRPNTIYGVTKVFAELLGEYFFARFGVDFRSLRFPGVISATPPGGGTTDYAIQMFFDALLYGKHKCYLRPDTMLPMMFSDDCTASVILMLLAPSERLPMRTYNVTGFSFTPKQLADRIRMVVPDFEMIYEICPFRQRIANTWPQSLDDSAARRDWDWRPEFDFESTVATMLKEVGEQLNVETRTEETEAEVLIPISATA